MRVGVHKNVKIVGCYVGESQEKKTPFFGLEIQTEEGTIEKDFFLTSTTQEKSIQLLIDAGYKGKSLADMADPKLSIQDLFGESKDELNITVIDEEYTAKDGTSKTRQVVQWFNVGYGNQKSKADLASAKVIFKNSSFDGLFAKMKKGEPGPKQERKNNDKKIAENAQDDDVPF